MYINTIRTILSLRKRTDYPMYSMTYYGDYAFDDFLKKGTTKDEDLMDFIQNRFTKKVAFDPNSPRGGCTAFLAQDTGGDFLYGRNYDFPPTPSIVVKTKPEHGYASVSIVDMMALGYTREKLPRGLSGKLPLLATPYLPFDGLNEKGLAVAILQVPEATLPHDPGKITLNTTTALRLMLDKGATVDEAVDLVSQYNLYFSLKVYCHYFIADKTGKSAILEYCDGKIRVTEEKIASNFYACNGVALQEKHESPNPQRRYEIAEKALLQTNGVLDMTEAAKLLQDLGIYYKEHNILQWSVVYNLSALKGMAFTGRDLSKPYYFSL